MVQILAAITAIVVMGVVNIGTVDGSNLGRDDSISLITAKFLQDTMPDMKNWRWPPGGHYLIVVRNTGKTPMEITDIRLDEVSVVDGLKRREISSRLAFGMGKT